MNRLFVALIVFSISALAQDPAPLITNIPHRTTISLNGTWHFIADPYDSGSFTYDGKTNEHSFFRNAHAKSKSDLVEYNFDTSPLLRVPGDWNTQRPDLLMYEGTIWYERSFTYHPQPGKRVFLYVGAANYLSRVGVNGTVVCNHQGGFTPYDCEVTSLLHEGENFVVIQVNDVRRKENVPTLSTDWWNYGGLTRDIMLVEVPQTFIQDYSLHLGAPFSASSAEGGVVKRVGDPSSSSVGEGWGVKQISGWIKLSDPTPGKSVTIRIPELSLEKTVTTDANGLAPIAVTASNLKLWSPSDPKLYHVEISSDDDKLDDDIGFRTIEVKGQDILLNGHPVFLKGVSIHEEAPYRSGRAFSDDDARTLLGWAKDLGANYVRLAHYPHNENMVRMAERMGLMVWSEVPVYWTIDWDNSSTLANAEQQVTESITRDKNRAAIIIWSVGNETPILPARNTFMHQMVETVRKLDNTRLVSAALQVHKVEGSTRILDDPLGAELDILGCNEYIGWYEGGFDDIDRAVYKTPYNKPLVMSEFGAEAPYGLHGGADTRWTEEFQEAVYQHQVKMLDRIPFLRGTSPWILMDFRSPRRWLPGVQDFYNRKGLVSDQGQKKKAFFVLQKWYESK
jgi:beta-glucuronidase